MVAFWSSGKVRSGQVWCLAGRCRLPIQFIPHHIPVTFRNRNIGHETPIVSTWSAPRVGYWHWQCRRCTRWRWWGSGGWSCNLEKPFSLPWVSCLLELWKKQNQQAHEKTFKVVCQWRSTLVDLLRDLVLAALVVASSTTDNTNHVPWDHSENSVFVVVVVVVVRWHDPLGIF